MDGKRCEKSTCAREESCAYPLSYGDYHGAATTAAACIVSESLGFCVFDSSHPFGFFC